MAIVAELGPADRGYYAQAEALDCLSGATAVVQGAVTARMESYEVRMVV